MLNPSDEHDVLRARKDRMEKMRTGSTRDPKPTQRLSILVVDDHLLVREGLALLLDDMEECGEVHLAATGNEAIDIIEKNDVDLVLLDLVLRGESGIDVLGRIREIDEDLPVIVLSATDDAEEVRRSITSGASGYVVKSASRDALVHAIELVGSGEMVVPVPLSSLTREPEQSRPGGAPMGGMNPHAKLTEREQGVLDLIGEGMSNKEIARALGILEGTVKVHVKSIYRKLGAKNRTVAALMARTGKSATTAVPATKAGEGHEE